MNMGMRFNIDEANDDIQITAGYFENEVHGVINRLRQSFAANVRLHLQQYSRPQRPNLLMSQEYERQDQLVTLRQTNTPGDRAEEVKFVIDYHNQRCFWLRNERSYQSR